MTDAAPRFRRLLGAPDGGVDSVTAAEAVADYGIARLAPPGELPYAALNMIATVDGRATIDGRSSGLGNSGDHALFLELRTRVDAVIVGARTVAVERYRPLVRDPQLRALRVQRGLEPSPLACIVSGSLNLPNDVPLLQDPDSRIVMLTASERELEGAAAQIEYLRGAPGAALNLAPMLRRLRAEWGVRSLLCEGGPTLNASLLAGRLADELFLTVAPKIAAGPNPLTIIGAPALSTPAELELRGLLELDDYLYLCYALSRA